MFGCKLLLSCGIATESSGFGCKVAVGKVGLDDLDELDDFCQ
jgi:hypothetical protein